MVKLHFLFNLTGLNFLFGASVSAEMREETTPQKKKENLDFVTF